MDKYICISNMSLQKGWNQWNYCEITISEIINRRLCCFSDCSLLVSQTYQSHKGIDGVSMCRLDLSVFGWLVLLVSPTSFLRMSDHCVTQLWIGQFWCLFHSVSVGCLIRTECFDQKCTLWLILICNSDFEVLQLDSVCAYSICFHKSPDIIPFTAIHVERVDRCNLNVTWQIYTDFNFCFTLPEPRKGNTDIRNQECFLGINLSERWKWASLKSTQTLYIHMHTMEKTSLILDVILTSPHYPSRPFNLLFTGMPHQFSSSHRPA